MKVIQNNYKDIPRNPHQLTAQTKPKIEKVKIEISRKKVVIKTTIDLVTKRVTKLSYQS